MVNEYQQANRDEALRLLRGEQFRQTYYRFASVDEFGQPCYCALGGLGKCMFDDPVVFSWGVGDENMAQAFGLPVDEVGELRKDIIQRNDWNRYPLPKIAETFEEFFNAYP